MTNGESSVGTSDAASSRTQSHLQIDKSRIEKLRQITRVCKNFLPKPKPNGSKLTLSTPDKTEVSPEKNSSKNAQSPDFVISSAGSSPAHSPEPMDFNVLSTPPRSNKPSEGNRAAIGDNVTTEPNSGDRQKACSKLVERFEESSNRTLPNGNCPDSRTSSDHEFSSVEVLDEGDQTRPVDSTVNTARVNGEISSSAATKNRNSPALSDLAPRVNAEESASSAINFNSDEFRQVSSPALLLLERLGMISVFFPCDWQKFHFYCLEMSRCVFVVLCVIFVPIFLRYLFKNLIKRL